MMTYADGPLSRGDDRRDRSKGNSPDPERIAYAKAQHAKDQVLAREWTTAGIKLGHWAKTINNY
jgi:hypothetical protein